MKRRGFIYLLLFLTIGLSLAASLGAGAQSAADTEAKRAQLQLELEAEEREIAAQTKLLQAKQRDTATVQGDINVLKSQIARSQASIKAKKVAISRLEDDIKAREGRITLLDSKIQREQASLAELLRKTRDTDLTSFTEILLDNESFSDFFNDVDDFEFVQKSIHQSFSKMRGAQEAAQVEKTALETKQAKELDAQKAIELEQAMIQKKESEKKVLLSINQTQEKAYQAVLKDRQRRAAVIRAALFALRDTAPIPFGKALEYANVAYQKTGVRPAFLLAILKQESNLGQNVGSCLITNLASGETRSVNSGRVFANGIHPTRDLPVLQTILAQLGRDPLSTKVSCPLSIGYGGAMGPAQFIPSTWKLLQTSIAGLVGKAVPDPWEPSDAFMASALYLSNLGAGVGSYSAEMNAACRYYSGKNCAAGPGAGYGSSVMAKAQDIQLNMIDPLQNN